MPQDISSLVGTVRQRDWNGTLYRLEIVSGSRPFKVMNESVGNCLGFFGSMTVAAQAVRGPAAVNGWDFWGLVNPNARRRPTTDETPPQPPDQPADSTLYRDQVDGLLRQRDRQATEITELRREGATLRRQLDTAVDRASQYDSLRHRVRELTTERDEASDERDVIAYHVQAILKVLTKLNAEKSADAFLADLLAQAKERPENVRFDAEGGFREI